MEKENNSIRAHSSNFLELSVRKFSFITRIKYSQVLNTTVKINTAIMHQSEDSPKVIVNSQGQGVPE